MGVKYGIAGVVVRVVFAAVFAVNVQCALSFAFAPERFVDGFMLADAGRVGEVAVAGLGVAFLMWNATYPAFIATPHRFPVLGWVILVQQVIGLIGELCLYATLSAEFDVLRSSLMRFIVFDGAGLVAMAAAFTWYSYKSERRDVL